VLRHLHHWSARGARLIILDNAPHPQLDVETITSQPSMTYMHSPNGFIAQLQSLDSLITTDFAVLCDDDNILLEDGLNSCLDVLRAQPEVSFAWGRAANFLKAFGKVFVDETYQRKGVETALDPDPLTRVRWHLATYKPSAWYAVHRADYFIRWVAVAALMHQRCSSSYASEMGTETAAFMVGRGVQVPILTLLRSLDDPPVDAGSRGRALPFREWLHTPEYAKEVSGFFQVGSDLVGEASPTSETSQAFELVIREAYPPPPRTEGLPSTSVCSWVLVWALNPQVVKRLRERKRRFFWWLMTKARGQFECCISALMRMDDPVILGDHFELSTEVDLKTLEEVPW
jgi:hypothetical protein